jgi:hypothetical protein
LVERLCFAAVILPGEEAFYADADSLMPRSRE